MHVNILDLRLQINLESLLNGIQVFTGSHVGRTFLLTAREGKVLGHDTFLVDNVDTGLLELLGEGNEFRGAVNQTTLDETTSPSVDGSNWVCRGLVALLVLTVVAGDCTVGSFRLECLSVRGGEGGGHETERSETLSDNVGLDITIVV